MELIFNELSLAPVSVDKYKANEKMQKFAEATSLAKNKGFKNIRSHVATSQIELAQNYSLHDWLTNKKVSEIYRNFMYGMIILPFINEDDEEIENKYIEANYYFEDKQYGFPKTQCVGLASAYLYETPSISLSSSPLWDKTKFTIIIEQGVSITTGDVFNISSKDSFAVREIADFVENLGEVTLIETELKPDDKKQHLGAHHGIAELKELCKQIKNSPYVKEMRSTDWGGKKFIRKTHKDGVIEIVLFKTQRQYALQVQTTGKNLRETNAIAEILENRYS